MESDGEGEPDCPNIRIDRDTKKRLGAEWRRAIVVKVLGRSFPFLFLQRRLQFLWAKTGTISVASMGQGFYSVRFTTERDYDRALFVGPWMIEDHYILTRHWKRGFDPDEGDDVLTNLLVWVRLPRLPMDYYDPIILRDIGNSIGRYIKMDAPTRDASRGHYARICVEVDLTKPLIVKYRLEKQNVGLHNVCFECGRFGHNEEVCPTKTLSSPTAEDFQKTQSLSSQRKIEEECPEIFEDFGPWMLATRNRRRNTGRTQPATREARKEGTASPAQTSKGGSRFALLEDLNDELMEHPSTLGAVAKEGATELDVVLADSTGNPQAGTNDPINDLGATGGPTVKSRGSKVASGSGLHAGTGLTSGNNIDGLQTLESTAGKKTEVATKSGKS
ncbi:unnamed protein product [Linum trigynum]|uniref:CCHC-type domain-containing protein n=1 Tax=Linum trigynum TaxID=586398 RepID=A0AAV2D5U0_9ROSI